MHGKVILTAESKYEILRDISESIRDTLDLDTILNKILDTIYSVINYDAAGIFVLSRSLIRSRYHRPQQIIAGVAGRGYDIIPPENDSMLREGKGIIGYVISSGKPVVAPDVSLDPRYIPGRSKAGCEIAVPIISQNRTIGALDIESDIKGLFTEEDLELLGFFADAVSISIEKAMLHIQIMEKKRFEEQMLIAKEIQANLLPLQNPNIEGYQITGMSNPTLDIGGDYFDFLDLGDKNIGLLVADVSGHGIPSALIMTAFRTLVKTYAPNYDSPSKLTSFLNSKLKEFLRKRDFITLFYSILDVGSGLLKFTSCGHNPPILLKADGNILKLETGDPSLNLLKKTEFNESSVSIDPGDLLVIYTDGVIEIFNEKGEDFGFDRFMKLVKSCKELDVNAIIDKIVQSTAEFSGSHYYRDDFTLMIIKREK
jgi:serine phosphatase RsbU (regulator of sigma subunit)